MSLEPAIRQDTCPRWCTAQHGQFDGEEDHVHTGAPVSLTPNVTARLCASVDVENGTVDGPYLLVDSHELTLDRARSVSEALIGLVAAATDDAQRETLPRPQRR